MAGSAIRRAPGHPTDTDLRSLTLARSWNPPFPTCLPDDVLIVEDDPIIALDFEDTILGFGVKTVRSAAQRRAGRSQMIADRAPEFALLDVGLVREKSFAIAERLEALKIPFAFVTGYGADGRRFRRHSPHKPRLPKPCSTEALEAVLRRGAR